MRHEFPSAAVCGNCGAADRLLLHDVRHRGNFRKLCTTCVLRLHSQSFCPTCFAVYQTYPPRNDAVSCFKCYSSSHAQCVAPNPPNPYICPLCVTNSPIFAPRKANCPSNADSKIGNSDNCRAIDKTAARVLLAAARIAAASMSKAALAAMAEAERRAKEAAVTRKRAWEAVEHFNSLYAMEKMRKKEALLVCSGGGNVGPVVVKRMNIGGNVSGGVVATPLPLVVKNERENLNSPLPLVVKNQIVENLDSPLPLVAKNQCENLDSPLPLVAKNQSENLNSPLPLVVKNERENLDSPLPSVVKNQSENLDRVDTSSEVLASLNAVDLTENERLQGFEGRNKLAGVQNPDNSVAMDMVENKVLDVGPDAVNGKSIVQNHDGGDANGNSENFAKFEMGNGHTLAGEQSNNVAQQ